MKKIFYLFSALALMAGFTACDEKEGPDAGLDLDNIVLDGFYVYGEATGTDKVLAENAMAAGSNEVEKKVRTGMYEKYVWLEANKDFSLIENNAGNKVYYGANLAEVNYGYDENDANCKNYDNNPNMIIQQGLLVVGEDAPAMQVKETGLYHIVLDNNANGDLKEGAQIIVQKADWGVRGGMNGWGFTKGEVKNENGVITYTWVDQDMSANGEFKFASCHGWKINLDADGIVKAEVSLGLDDEGKLNNNANNNIKVGEKAGLYKIVLTYSCKAGALADSFTYTIECTQESTMPTECYLIGDAIAGWALPGNEVAMVPAHSEPGSFWAIRYIADATKGFKFSQISTGWGKDFTGLGTDTGYTVADGNCFVAEAGFYMIEVDYKNNVVTVSPAEVYGIGDAFGGWTEGVYPFEAAEGTLTASVTAAGNLRMYAKSTFAAAAGNWWHREFNIFEGKIVYRAEGGDQEAVAVTAGQTVTLDFNAGTGSIQ